MRRQIDRVCRPMHCCVRCGRSVRPQRCHEDVRYRSALPTSRLSSPILQLGSREKVIFSLDNNPKRHSVLKHVRNARSDIPVDTFIMKFAMPEIISDKTKEDNARVRESAPRREICDQRHQGVPRPDEGACSQAGRTRRS